MSTQSYLEELRASQDLEALRVELQKRNLFGRHKDPQSAPITEAALKELVKQLNIHRGKAGFWRDHPTKPDLVRAIHQYLAKTKDRGAISGPPRGLVPAPPAEPKFKRAGRIKTSPRKAQLNLSYTYSGDLFGQREGGYDAGMVYLSRMKTHDNPNNIHSNPYVHPESMAAPPEPLTAYQRAERAHRRGLPPVNNENQTTTTTKKKKKKEKKKLEEGDMEIKRQCARSLHAISMHPGGEGQMAAEGGVGTLARLASVGDRVVSLFTAAALANLVATDDAAVIGAILSDGFYQAVSTLSGSTATATRGHCAHALARLTTAADGALCSRAALEGAGVVLMALARSSLADGHADVAEVALRGINNVAGLPGASLPSGLVDLLGRFADDDSEAGASARRCATRVLLNLSSQNAKRLKLVEDQGIEVLQRLLGARAPARSHAVSRASSPTAAAPAGPAGPAPAPPSPADAEIVGMVATATANLCSIRSSHANSVAARASLLAIVERLLQLGAEDKEVALATTIALAHATSVDESFCAAVVNSPVVVAALARLTSKGNSWRQIAAGAAATLRNIALVPDLLALLVRDDVIDALISLVQVTARGLHQEISAQTLCFVVAKQSAEGYAIGDQVVNAFVALGSSTSPPLQHACCLAMLNLSALPEVRGQLVSSGAMGTLVSLCRRVAPATRLLCLGAVHNLCLGDAERRRGFVEEGLVDLLTGTYNAAADDEERLLVVSTLYSLCDLCGPKAKAVATCLVDLAQRVLPSAEEASSLRAMRLIAGALCSLGGAATPDVLPTLMALAETGDTVTALRCSQAFASLAASEADRERVAQLPDVARCLVSVMRCGDVTIQSNLAEALTSLSAVSCSHWSAEVINDFVVVALLRVNEQRARLHCAHTLSNLLLDEARRADRLKLGALYALVKLAKQDKALRGLCVAVIGRLAVDASHHDVLVQNGALPVLVEWALDGADEAAGCLCLLSANPAHIVAVVHAGAVRVASSASSLATAGLLRNVAAHAEPRAAALHSPSAVSVAIGFCDAFPELGVPILHELSVDEAALGVLTTRGAVAALVRHLGINGGGVALLALHNVLLRHPAARPVAVEAGVVAALKSLALSNSPVVAAVVCILSVESELAEALVDAGAVAVLAAAAAAGDGSASRDVLLALLQLSAAAPAVARQRLVEDGAREAATAAVAGLPEPDPTRCFAALLRNLSVSPAAAADPLGADSMAQLLRIAQDRRSPIDALRNVAFALLNGQGRSGQALVALSESRDVETTQIATIAITSLDQKRKAAATDDGDDGLVHTLTALMELDQQVMERLRAEALLPAPALAPPVERRWGRVEAPQAHAGYRCPFEPSPWAAEAAEHRPSPPLPPADPVPSAPVTANAEGLGGDEPLGTFAPMAVDGDKREVLLEDEDAPPTASPPRWSRTMEPAADVLTRARKSSVTADGAGLAQTLPSASPSAA